MSLKRFVSLCLITVLTLTLVGAVTAQDEAKVLTVNFPGESDVPTLDPAHASDTSSIQVISLTTPGLTRLHEITVELEPGMATWEVSDDGLVYTFNIIPEVSWVQYNPDSGAVEQVLDDSGNPRFVTAADFAYGMARSIQIGDYYGGILATWVANGAEVMAGEMDAADLGLDVLDTYVLQVTAPQPAAFLANIYGMWMAYAVPEWNVEANGDFAFDGDAVLSYGPYAVKQWLHGESITMIKNPFWAGTESIPAAAIDEIVGLVLSESASFDNFLAGTMDVTTVPLDQLDRVKADADLSQLLFIGPSSCTYYYGFNSSKAPTDDVRVRRALSMSLDRQSLIDNVLKGGQTPAYFMSREGALAAAPMAVDYPDMHLNYDVAGAQALLQEYMDANGFASAADIPAVVLMHNDSQAHALIAQAIAQMWKDSLGIEVQIQTQEWGTYLSTIGDPGTADETAPPVWRLGWCQDYPDAHNFLFDVFHSSVSTYGLGWHDELRDQFDTILEEAMVETDLQTRTDMYAEAESILTDEAAAIAPIYFYTTVSVTQPWVERTYSGLGQQAYEKWDIDLAAK